MENAVMEIERIKQAWRDLTFDVPKNKKIKFEVFESAFSQTYALLLAHIDDKSLDKNLVELIAEAYLFANIKDDSLDSTCLAAFVLTERMLAGCAFGNAGSLIEASSIYIAEARRKILLDFGDVDSAISQLIKVFDGLYWNKVN